MGSWIATCSFSARLFLLATLRALLSFQVSFDFFVLSLGAASVSIPSSSFPFSLSVVVAHACALVMACRRTTMSDSDELGVPVEGILSMKLRVVLPFLSGCIGQSCTKYLTPQSLQNLNKGCSSVVYGFSFLG